MTETLFQRACARASVGMEIAAVAAEVPDQVPILDDEGEPAGSGESGAVYLDSDGYLFLTGRSAEVIISGGVNIYPQEIDDVLASHPSASDVACVGVPNAEWGEEVKAIVRLRDGLIESDELKAKLIAYCAERLANQEQPRSVDFISDLPRSHAGKVQRKAFRDTYWEGRERKI